MGTINAYLTDPHVTDVHDGLHGFSIMNIDHADSEHVHVALMFRHGNTEALAFVSEILTQLGVDEFHWNGPVQHENTDCDPDCLLAGAEIPAIFAATVGDGSLYVYTDVEITEDHELQTSVVVEQAQPAVTRLSIVN